MEPQHLELELTERVFVENLQSHRDAFHRLRDLGVRVALDDFGVGYSSLHYLKTFPISALKIDGRPNSTLRNVTVETPREFGLRHGITIVDSPGTVFEDVTIETSGIPLRIERPSTSPGEYAVEFRGTNEFSTRGNFGLDASRELPIGDDGTAFPFREVGEDVSALLVTGAEEDRLRFRRVRG